MKVEGSGRQGRPRMKGICLNRDLGRLEDGTDGIMNKEQGMMKEGRMKKECSMINFQYSMFNREEELGI
ncbi:hypothetical protein SY85_20875 [Flavisolibacter tropicus]|uniref:Uncharacterized protein n=1 Tax=Flavisolibacter tropicus TaxID=1492898 RepID=A0A172TZY7_9BACT|nr:hypothetical protein SY85_20875 [Flavisolibacter tropicus]